MKLLKGLLIIVLIILGIGTVLALLGPKEFKTERSIVINAPSSMVYNNVVDFNNWAAWSPWANKDTTMVTTVEGAPGVGSKMSWTSAESGNGNQELTEAVANESINTQLTFSDWEGTSYANWKFEEVEEGTKVTWSMDGGELPFFGRAFMMVMDGVGRLETDYDEGLASLKTIIEAMPTFEPVAEDLPSMNYIGKSVGEVTMEDLENGALHGASYGEIGMFMGTNEIQMAGMPICITHTYNEGTMDLTFAMPVMDSLEVAENLVSGTIPGGKCLTTIHYGSYETLDQAWGPFSEYIKSNNIEVRHAPYEIYMNDPTTVSDPSEIMTKIVYPI
ncbi:MAG: SRPBCC family protein [Flavobacteriales bacterium]|nr:SRPBCC family protein [Flavobacteriales bacterium]MDG1780577.1 SRPBCC family protein [Flavobacteriales bacterium]MDG2246394.1 SRPBCC family protein [Flavobacteriales bacterium]